MHQADQGVVQITTSLLAGTQSHDSIELQGRLGIIYLSAQEEKEMSFGEHIR